MVTVLDVARARGCTGSELTLGDFQRVGLPMFGGCEACGASIAAYNACPSRTGYLRCRRDCIGDLGFETVADFEAWCKAESDREARESGPEELPERRGRDTLRSVVERLKEAQRRHEIPEEEYSELLAAIRKPQEAPDVEVPPWVENTEGSVLTYQQARDLERDTIPGGWYDRRVLAHEHLGMTRSDAQALVDLQIRKAKGKPCPDWLFGRSPLDVLQRIEAAVSELDRLDAGLGASVPGHSIRDCAHGLRVLRDELRELAE